MYQITLVHTQCALCNLGIYTDGGKTRRRLPEAQGPMRASKEESAPSPGATKPISFGAALCNTLKSVFGTGLLALPYGFALVGPAPAATISLLLGLYSAFTMHLLARAVELQKQLDDDHLTADATPNAPLLGQGRPSATAGGGGSDPFSQVFFLSLDPFLPYVRAHFPHIPPFEFCFFSAREMCPGRTDRGAERDDAHRASDPRLRRLSRLRRR